MYVPTISIRSASPADAAALLAIYAPYVERTAISFELAPPTVEELARRVAEYSRGWAWLVAEQGAALVGYAYGSPHRQRPAYRWSTETTVYVAPGAQRQGIGTALYGELLARLEHAGFCNAYAGIALPNAASVALHRSVGFRHIGTFPAVGRKFGAWHDVAWYHRPLRVGPPPAGPLGPDAMLDSPAPI